MNTTTTPVALLLVVTTALLVLLVPAIASCAPAPRGAADASSVLHAMIDERKTPGLQYAFLDAERVLFSASLGRAELATARDVDAATTFNGFSLTKTFTAAAVLQLAEAGALDLDDPLSQWVDGLPDDDDATIRQALGHLAGFANPNPIGWAHLASDHASFDHDAFVRTTLTAHGRLEARPGERFAYSNVGYLALGEVIRAASGTSYTDYVEREVIAPLGLTGDDALSFAIDDEARHSRGHVEQWSLLNAALGLFIDRDELMRGSIDGWSQFEHILVDGAAYGGIVGNASGFARYLQAILRAEAPFSEAIVAAMLEEGTTTSGERVPMGLGWFSGTLNGEVYFAHAGAGGGHYCEIRVYPKRKLASVLLLNRAGVNDERLLDTIDVAFLDEPARAGPRGAAAR